MPFMKGRAALRRTLDWLEKGQILFRDNVRILTFNYASQESGYPHHSGLNKFVFWHLPQLKYKNPNVQLVTLDLITPSPWIKAYLADESHVLIDCDSRSREEIHDHLRKILGKTEEVLELERQQEEAIKANPGNFGYTSLRQCMCEVPGQIPCPAYEALPIPMRGKYRIKILQGEMTKEEVQELEEERLKAAEEKQSYSYSN